LPHRHARRGHALCGLRLAAARAPIILILLDIKMPGMSGLELLTESESHTATNKKFAAVHRSRLALRGVLRMSTIWSLLD
jgi:CheY-like chemotaxis protein